MSQPPPARIAETHSGLVVAVGDRVYKAKKAVDLGFLDFTTVERRGEVCRREVELNRRLAPDVYLGVSDVRDPDGEVCEYLVVMRRMPDRRALDALADGATEPGESVEDRVREVADLIARFHADADRGPQIDDQARAPALRRRWRANLDELYHFAGDPLDESAVEEVDRLATSFVDGREDLFERRVGERRIVDGHGDLLCSDTFCLSDGPRILDCVEFDDRLRHTDGLDDAAGLVMDLHVRDHGGLAETFLRRYRDAADDDGPPALVDHYVASRAVIRCKAACLRREQEDGTDREASGDRARTLLRVAAERLRRAVPALVLVGGPPGSGKSTLAADLGERLGARVLDSDRVRKELAGLDPDAAAPAGADLYSAERTGDTYAELMRRASSSLRYAEPVVLDASWTDATQRERASDVARRTASREVALRCTVDPDTAADRAAKREPGPSDAGPETAARLAAEADAWPGAHAVDTGAGRDRARDQALAALE